MGKLEKEEKKQTRNTSKLVIREVLEWYMEQLKWERKNLYFAMGVEYDPAGKNVPEESTINRIFQHGSASHKKHKFLVRAIEKGLTKKYDDGSLDPNKVPIPTEFVTIPEELWKELVGPKKAKTQSVLARRSSMDLCVGDVVAAIMNVRLETVFSPFITVLKNLHHAA